MLRTGVERKLGAPQCRRAHPDAASAVRSVYKPRDRWHRRSFDGRGQSASAADCLRRAFRARKRPIAPVVAQVKCKFLACGVLEDSFARIRCDASTQEYLHAFS
jgi:hypothetical protein